MIYLSRPRTRIDEVCQSSVCDYYRKTKGKDIIRKGTNRSGTQMYKCLHCNKYFVQTSGTVFYRKRLPKTKVEQLCRALVEKNGIRSTGRLTQLNPITVARWHDDIAKHAQEIDAYLTRDLGLSEYETDEFWTTVKKNRNTTDPKITSHRARVKRGATPALSATHTFSSRFPSENGRRKPARF